MLMPAVVLILVVLGAIAVDSATIFLAQRELVNAAAAAANDAAAAAMDDAAFYEDGDVVIDAARAREVALSALAARSVSGVTIVGAPEVLVDGDRVQISIRGSVPLVFSPAVPGVRADITIAATASATAVEQ